MKALSLNATKTETKTETKLLDRIVNTIESGACCVVESLISGEARTEVFVATMTQVMPDLRKEAKAKAEARMAARYARFIK